MLSVGALQQGQEVTINYLGRGSLCAVDERQQELSAGYGFDCMCPRCMWELGATGAAATVSVSVPCVRSGQTDGRTRSAHSQYHVYARGPAWVKLKVAGNGLKGRFPSQFPHCFRSDGRLNVHFCDETLTASSRNITADRCKVSKSPHVISQRCNIVKK